ncbi:hypothetical protein FRX31_019190 [Thalictrum thalictroides]|uniref:Uncharacterized protein n=1 Tax=Thalictrum thalictroides TaxID=46969 RepID=A0A7J6W289_THATH|nr:hypothetical protein FRX31_019190 [Thalictrum thalictroides]
MSNQDDIDVDDSDGGVGVSDVGRVDNDVIGVDDVVVDDVAEASHVGDGFDEVEVNMAVLSMGLPKKPNVEKTKTVASASGKKRVEVKKKAPVGGKNFISLIPNQPYFNNVFGSRRIEPLEVALRKRKVADASKGVDAGQNKGINELRSPHSKVVLEKRLKEEEERRFAAMAIIGEGGETSLTVNNGEEVVESLGNDATDGRTPDENEVEHDHEHRVEE